MMKVSFTFDRFMKVYGIKEAIQKASDFGFDAVDFSFFSMDWDFFKKTDEELKVYFTDVKKHADSLGIEIGQTHSHFPTWTGDEKDEERLFLQIQDIKATAHMGCNYVVVHPQVNGLKDKPFDKAVKERNMKFYSSLLPTLKEYGVTACIENMWGREGADGKICAIATSTADELLDYVETLNDEHFAVCHDVGHTNLINCGDYADATPENEVRKLKDHLAVLHVHDTDGVSDLHTLPYAIFGGGRRTTHWEAYCKALKEIGFKGIMNLETCFPIFFGEDLEAEAGAFALKIARKLAGMVEN